MNDFEKSIQEQINGVIGDGSFGVAVLKNGAIVNVRKNFNELKELYIHYNFLKEADTTEFINFLRETKGCFDNTELTVQLNNIQFIIDGAETIRNNKTGMSKIDYTGFTGNILNLFTNMDEEDDDEEDV